MPFLAVIKLNSFVNHWIVILGHIGKKIYAFDPLRGKIDFTESDLKSVWLKRCVVYKKRIAP